MYDHRKQACSLIQLVQVSLSIMRSDATSELCPSSHSQEVIYIQDEDSHKEEEAVIARDKQREVKETDLQKAARRRKNSQRA